VHIYGELACTELVECAESILLKTKKILKEANCSKFVFEWFCVKAN